MPYHVHIVRITACAQQMRGCCVGSGKTRIAVELAGSVLQKKPQAKIVFLATTVALAQQQAGEEHESEHLQSDMQYMLADAAACHKQESYD